MSAGKLRPRLEPTLAAALIWCLNASHQALRRVQAPLAGVKAVVAGLLRAALHHPVRHERHRPMAFMPDHFFWRITARAMGMQALEPGVGRIAGNRQRHIGRRSG